MDICSSRRAGTPGSVDHPHLGSYRISLVENLPLDVRHHHFVSSPSTFWALILLLGHPILLGLLTWIYEIAICVGSLSIQALYLSIRSPYEFCLCHE